MSGEWVDVGRTYKVSHDEDDWADGDYFTLRPGMLLEYRREDGIIQRILIGDTNDSNGGCGCCQLIDVDDFIIRYRMVNVDD